MRVWGEAAGEGGKSAGGGRGRRDSVEKTERQRRA